MRLACLILSGLFIFASCTGGDIVNSESTSKAFSELDLNESEFVQTQNKIFSEIVRDKDFVSIRVIANERLRNDGEAEITILSSELGMYRKYDRVELIYFKVLSFVDGILVESGQVGRMLYASDTPFNSSSYTPNYDYFVVAEYPENEFQEKTISVSVSNSEFVFLKYPSSGEFEEGLFTLFFNIFPTSFSVIERVGDGIGRQLGEVSGYGGIYTSINY